MLSLLAIADGGAALEATIAAATHFARLVGGEAQALHVRDALADHRSGHSAYAIGPAIDATLKAGEAKAATRAAAARAVYERLAAGLSNTRFIDTDGDEDARATAYGRLCDIIVIGRPGADQAKPEPAHVRAAVFHTGRGVMVVPPQWQPGAIDHAVVAWNGTPQAARALGHALPLLRHAAKVTVASADKGDEEGIQPDASAVADYLTRRGVKASAARFDPGAGSARARGRALLNCLAAQAGDFLVMGAYGEPGMLRFLGLGGATGKVITGCPAPVLLAH